MCPVGLLDSAIREPACLAARNGANFILSVRLFAYLGVGEDEKLALYVSSQRLNIIGTRLEKGSKFPHAVYNFTENPGDDNAILALRGVQDYIDGKGQRSGLVFGEEIRKKRRK